MLEIYKVDKHLLPEGGIEEMMLVIMKLKGYDGLIQFGYNNYQKPYLKDYPDIHFNGSHSGEYLVCALSDVPVGIDIQKIDNMYNDYVLPLSIKSVSEYKIAEDKYSKGLFHIKWKNFFSGNYTGELNVYLTKGNGDNDNDNKQTISTKEYYAISLNECYFYAGQFGRNNIERNDFIVKILMENDGTITLSSPNSDLNLNQESSSVKTERVPHTTDKRKEIVTTTIFLKYTYTNLADSDKPKLRAEGSMSMSKEVFKNEIVNN